jgi:2-keto-4-pentenoate hydratase/2-oxohepta-3-ene-1,7-dioic acid hydratase in catechol pathway
VTHYVRFTLDLTAPPTLTDAAGARYGILEGETIRPVRSLFAPEPDGVPIPRGQVRILPEASPSKIVCVGRNYAAHAKELGNDIPAEPLIFLKPPSSLVADGDGVVYPKLSSNLHFEGELGLIVGKRARNIKAEDWREYVWGYTCVNDVTARDLQRKDGQWTRGKGFDTFCPTGLWSVPLQEVEFESLRVQTWLDGKCVQDAPVTDMIFPPGAILAYVTQFLTLEPGDLIATGTPEGVGPMQIGSTVRVAVPGVGQVENPIVAEQ